MRRSLIFLVLVLGMGARLAQAQAPPDPIFRDGFDLLDPGDSCVASEECASGFCVDGVCCTSACTGTCMACDLASSLGTCAPIADGQDPANECGSLSCAEYYWGWLGRTCYQRADIPAQQAFCSGAGACRTAAMDCPTAPQGSAVLTCFPVPDCETPNYTTCRGTEPPSCQFGFPGCIPQ